MYHAVIRKVSKRAFRHLSEKNTDALLNLCRYDLHHRFAGNHALGGERHSKQAFKLWLNRLFKLFPDIQFKISDVMVSGMPWNTRVAIVWQDEATAADGVPYVNQGVHILHIKWGKLQSLDAKLDTQVLAKAMNRMAKAGIEEADAKMIEHAE